MSSAHHLDEEDPSEEDPIEIESQGEFSVSPKMFSETEVKGMLEKAAKKMEEEKGVLEEELKDQEAANTVLRGQIEALTDEKDRYEEDFSATLMRVGNAGPEAYYTRADVEYLADQSRPVERVEVLKLEETIAECHEQMANLEARATVWEDKCRIAKMEVRTVHAELERHQREMVDLRGEVARLTRDLTVGTENLKFQVRMMTRELQRRQGASTSTPLAKRPRID